MIPVDSGEIPKVVLVSMNPSGDVSWFTICCDYDNERQIETRKPRLAPRHEYDWRYPDNLPYFNRSADALEWMTANREEWCQVDLAVAPQLIDDPSGYDAIGEDGLPRFITQHLDRLRAMKADARKKKKRGAK